MAQKDRTDQLRRAEPTPAVPLTARTTRVPTQDPLRFLAQRAGSPRFYYRSRGFTYAASGIALQTRASGPQRFRRVRDEAASLLATLGVEREAGVPEDARPVWIGGFAFEPDDEGRDAADFPAARFFLPIESLRIQADGTYHTTVLPRGGTVASATPTKPTEASSPQWVGDIDSDEWTRRVRTALQEIRVGKTEKLVLARSIGGTVPQNVDLTAVLGRFQAQTPQSTVFLIEPTPGHAWLGASPEVLVRRGQGRIETAAIAGTRPRGRLPDEDLSFERNLRASSKDAWEHELVCRFIRSSFDAMGRECRVTQDRGILKLPNVQHLETRFEAASVADEHLLDLAERLHPTPAVSGSPQETSLPLVRAIEGRARGWYAGAIGVFDGHGDGELVVGIRSAHVHGTHVRLTAGCGIVSGSDPADEWNEGENKFQITKRAFDATRPL